MPSRFEVVTSPEDAVLYRRSGLLYIRREDSNWCGPFMSGSEESASILRSRMEQGLIYGILVEEDGSPTSEDEG